jgi:hypothetical protein
MWRKHLLDLLAVLFNLLASLDGNGHTEHESLFTFPNVPPKLPPSWVSGERSGFNSAAFALDQRQQLIAETVLMETRKSFRNYAGFCYRLVKKICTAWIMLSVALH